MVGADRENFGKAGLKIALLASFFTEIPNIFGRKYRISRLKFEFYRHRSVTARYLKYRNPVIFS